MKILFTAPRFHTNQSAIVKGLTGKGHEVKYFVVYVGATEDHSVITPLVLKPSKTTIKERKSLLKSKNESEVESIIGGHFIPDFKAFKRAFEEFMPDVVVCREKTPLTLFAKSLCDKYGISCVLYDQEPIYKLKQPAVSVGTTTKRSFFSRIAGKLEKFFNPDRRKLNKMRLISGFPTVHMTPVKYSVIKSGGDYEIIGEGILWNSKNLRR